MRTLKSFPTVKPAKSGIKIDFDRALDTKVHELKRGVDFGTAAYIAREALRQTAKKCGLKVRVVIADHDTVVVQAVN